jgi:hypothetical protein
VIPQNERPILKEKIKGSKMVSKSKEPEIIILNQGR